MATKSGVGVGLQEGSQAEPPIRVLLISDVFLMRVGVRHVLESSGRMQVLEASSWAEGQGVAAQDQPHVILVDLATCPDHLATLQTLVCTAADSRVIVLAENGRHTEYAALIERGVLGLVLKNEHPEVLIKAIRKVHAGEVWLDRCNTARILTGICRRRYTEDLESAKIAALTRREREIVELVGDGLRNAVIAERLFISEATVRNHLTSILDKLTLSDRFELAVYAFRNGLVRPSRPPRDPGAVP